MNIVATAIALATTVLTLAPTSATAAEPTRAHVRTHALASLVDGAVADFRRLDDGKLGAHPYAWMAETIAIRKGWHHPLVKTYLRKVYKQQNPDGGYGINRAWDAFQDGSENPADTTYAITLTDHVGPVFLHGYEAGVVPGWRVRQVVRLVEKFPLANTPGTCVSYSTTPADAAYCTGNINASAAHFLVRARDAGFRVDLSRVRRIVQHNRTTLIDGEWWPYIDGQVERQDWYHNVTMVEAAMDLDPKVGRRTLNAMRRATVRDPWERAAMLRLARFDCRLANPVPLAKALDQHAGDSYYMALLAYEGVTALDACD